VDLFPFITGFGGTYWNDSVDVSALRTLLKGSVQFGGTVENFDWKMTLTIEEIPGGNTFKKAIWAAKVIDSGTVWSDSLTNHQAADITAAARAKTRPHPLKIVA
jgi:hypothetical protein